MSTTASLLHEFDPVGAVYGLFILDVLQTCLVTADAFHWFVFGFGNMDRLDDTFFNSWDVPFLDAIIATIVQTFYCWRICILSNSLVFPVIIFLVRPPPATLSALPCTHSPCMTIDLSDAVRCWNRYWS